MYRQTKLWSESILVTSVQPKSSEYSNVPRLLPPEFNPLSLLLGNPEKAERSLGWKRRIDFNALVTEMVTADLKAAASLVEDQN